MSLRWYVVNVHSGFEKRAKSSIEEQVQRNHLEEKFGQILVPCEEVVEVRQGVKVNVEKNYFPGYILVQMQLDDETWHLVCSVPKVSGFLGNNKSKPIPLSNAEVERIINQVKESTERPRHAVIFEIGEPVKVNDGPFASFNGVVEEIDEEKSRLKVSVMIFGRPTPVDLDFSQVEKI